MFKYNHYLKTINLPFDKFYFFYSIIVIGFISSFISQESAFSFRRNLPKVISLPRFSTVRQPAGTLVMLLRPMVQ